MNIRKFKELVREWDNYEKNFYMFRVWVENSYELFEKQISLDIEEDIIIFGYDAEDYAIKERMKFEAVDIHILIELCSKLGIKLDESIKNTQILFDSENITAYYDIKLSDVMKILFEVDDNVEFGFGILYLAKAIPDSDRAYTRFIRKILNGLQEYDLDKCLELVGKGARKVFIAMSFDEAMKETREKIISAVKNCGYTPMLIDIKEHNNQIVPEIYSEIDESEFVIADLTGQRGGVYYEAGYAVAKGKTLILCCKDGENPHFDVAQINTIFWKNEQELNERLIKRIRATIGMND